MTNWEMMLNFSLTNTKRSQLAKGSFYFYFLRDNPQKMPSEFARGLNQLFSGLMLEMKEYNSKMQVTRE